MLQCNAECPGLSLLLLKLGGETRKYQAQNHSKYQTLHYEIFLLTEVNLFRQDHVVHCEKESVECPNGCGLFVVRKQVGNMLS